MRGWTSRRPEHFEMAPTICINAKSDGKPVYMATVFSFDTSATNLSIVAKQPNGLTISWSSKNQENSDIRIEYEEEQILVSQNKYLKDTLKRILDPKNIEVQKIYRAQALNKNFQVEKIDPKIGLARIRELQASIRRSDKKIRYEEVLNELAVLEEAGIRSAAKLSGDILFAAEMSELDQKEGLQSYLRAAQKGHDGALKKLEEIRHETKLPENIERWLDSRGSQ
jgi:hypothetical protein